MYKIGLIGIGYWGPNIAKSFELTGKAKIHWLCDTNKQRLKEVSAKYPQAKTTEDLTPILEDQEITAVAISTPVNTHYNLARKVLEADKHLLLEKPLTQNSQQAIELVNLAKKRKKILIVGHVFEYNASIRALKELIVSKELGEIHYISCERTNLGPVRTDVNALWDLGTHDISITNYFFEKPPKDVTARGHTFLNPGVEDVVFATFTFDNGPIVHIHTSWVNPRKVRQIVVVGSEKMAVWDDLDLQAPIRVYNKKIDLPHSSGITDTFLGHKTAVVDGGAYVPKIQLNQPLLNECHHFLECIEQNKTPLSDSISGLRVVAALEAATYSMKNSSEITAVNIPEH